MRLCRLCTNLVQVLVSFFSDAIFYKIKYSLKECFSSCNIKKKVFLWRE